MIATRNSFNFGFLFVAGVLALMLLALLTQVPVRQPVQPWSPNRHAEERHGLAEAEEARQWVQSNGQFCRWQCPDGRDRFACGMPGGRWAVVVLEGTAEVTAFITDDHGYIRSIIDPCSNPWRYSH